MFPDPPTLAFFNFLAFFRFPISLAFLVRFSFLSKDFRGSAKRKTLAFFGISLVFFQKSKGWRVRVWSTFGRILVSSSNARVTERTKIAKRNRCDFPSLGHTPSTVGTFLKKFRKNSGKTPEMLSERFLEFPSRVRLGCPKPYNSRHLMLPEHFQNYLPPAVRLGTPLFSELVPERASPS